MRSFFTCALIVALSFAGTSIARAQDKSPAAGKSVSIEVLIVDLPAGTIAKGGEADDPTPERILDLEKQGKLSAFTRIRLASLENQQASVQFGETVGVASGRSFSGFSGGRAAAGGDPDRARGGPLGTTTYSMQNLGTLVAATPRVEQDGAVLVELSVEQTRLMEQPLAADAEKADATNITPARTTMVQARATLRVPAGKSVVTGGQRSTGKDARQTWIVVSAKVLEGK